MSKACRAMVLIATAVLCMANTECGEEYSCEGACNHLARCEDQWLAEEGGAPMSDIAAVSFVDACVNQCIGMGTFDEIQCVEDESCDRLRDGKCSE